MPAYPHSFRVNPRGFTLIELLVAISILAVVGMYFLVDFGPFKKEQALITVTNNIQSFIRVAQTNATAGVLCAPVAGKESAGSPWSVNLLLSEKKLEIICENTDPAVEKVLNLPSDMTFQLKLGTTICEADNCGIQKIRFSSVYGSVCFEKSDKTCDTSKSLEIKTSLDTTPGKSVIINTGGSVYVQ